MNSSIVKIGFLGLLVFAPLSAVASAFAVVSDESRTLDVQIHPTSATAWYADGGSLSSGIGSFSRSGTAYAHSGRGELGVAATVNASGGVQGLGLAEIRGFARLFDELMFNGPGTVSFRLAVQGSLFALGDAGIGAHATLKVHETFAGLIQFPEVFLSCIGADCELSALSGASVISALPSNTIVWLETSYPVMSGTKLLVDMALDIGGDVRSNGIARGLFDHTAQLSIFLPEGVTFTSASGNLLSASPAAVPEPESIYLMISGMLLIGGFASRRRAVRACLPAS